MDSVYHVSNFLQQITLRTFADWRVTGTENVPPMGPLVVIANHMSNVDSSLLGASIPRRLNYLAKDDIFRAGGPIGKWFLTNYGAFPIDRAGADARAFRWALRKLQRDAALVIFPEGTRSRNASMNQAKRGAVSLILKSGVPVLPVGITGTEGLHHFLRVANPTGRLRVNIGQPFSLPSIEGRPSRELLESLMTDVMSRVRDLLPESYHGYYARTKTPV
jgi:1-acyl-sn-glycerol-3-phosphate acyltransferase